MNMCLLQVAMCKKCRSSHFQSEGGVKSLSIVVGWGGGGGEAMGGEGQKNLEQGHSFCLGEGVGQDAI